MTDMKIRTDRRRALIGLSVGLMASGLAQGDAANAAPGATLEPSGANNLRDLSRALAAMPRRRDFATRPMIADNPDVWDAAPLNAVFAYKGGPKQAWDNTDLTGPWLNAMRNSLNSQIWGFRALPEKNDSGGIPLRARIGFKNRTGRQASMRWGSRIQKICVSG